MLEVLSEIGDYLGELNIVSVVLRLLLAMGLGGVLGVEQGKKGVPPGSAPTSPCVWPLLW